MTTAEDEAWVAENWPTIAHDARTEHRRTGHARWRATCPCGWKSAWDGSKEDNQLLARIHNGLLAQVRRLAEQFICTCEYDVQTMEYSSDDVCEKHLLLAVLDGAL